MYAIRNVVRSTRLGDMGRWSDDMIGRLVNASAVEFLVVNKVRVHLHNTGRGSSRNRNGPAVASASRRAHRANVEQGRSGEVSSALCIPRQRGGKDALYHLSHVNDFDAM